MYEMYENEQISLSVQSTVYAGYIIRKIETDLNDDEMKISGRNINNVKYSDEATLLQKIGKTLFYSFIGFFMPSSPNLGSGQHAIK